MESAQNLGTEKPPPLLASDGVRIFEKETILSFSPSALFDRIGSWKVQGTERGAAN
jgi:hypothetical protein